MTVADLLQAGPAIASTLAGHAEKKREKKQGLEVITVYQGLV